MTRAPLFNSRLAKSFEIEHFDPLAGDGGRVIRYHITVGYYADGKTIGEVFVTPLGKAGRGSMLEALARDAAVLISLATQHGCPLETQRRAITRDEQNRPLTLVGAVLDAMEG